MEKGSFIKNDKNKKDPVKISPATISSLEYRGQKIEIREAIEDDEEERYQRENPIR